MSFYDKVAAPERTRISQARTAREGANKAGYPRLQNLTILKCYMEYYNAVRTHLSLGKDAPIWRDIQRAGRIEVRPVLSGLHHQYVRI